VTDPTAWQGPQSAWQGPPPQPPPPAAKRGGFLGFIDTLPTVNLCIFIGLVMASAIVATVLGCLVFGRALDMSTVEFLGWFVLGIMGVNVGQYTAKRLTDTDYAAVRVGQAPAPAPYPPPNPYPGYPPPTYPGGPYAPPTFQPVPQPPYRPAAPPMQDQNDVIDPNAPVPVQEPVPGGQG
jgi:hypothetical protein